MSDNLRPLPADRTYQLWALGEAAPISAGVIGPNLEVVAFSAPPQASGLAVSEEVAGAWLRRRTRRWRWSRRP